MPFCVPVAVQSIVPVAPAAGFAAHETCCDVQSHAESPWSPSCDSEANPLGSVKVLVPPAANQSAPPARMSVQFLATVAKPVALPWTGLMPAAVENVASE